VRGLRLTEHKLAVIVASKSWRFTTPLRTSMNRARGLLKR
jgi:hypothetical protein